MAVHARLDEETLRLLECLRRQTGQRDSEIIRRAIRTLADLELRPGESRIVGIGKFHSGLSDLGSNKKHLERFGKS